MIFIAVPSLREYNQDMKAKKEGCRMKVFKKVFKIYFYIMLAVAIICSIAGKTLMGGILLTIMFVIPYTIWIPVFIWAVMETYKAFKK